jgi:hypothetical protein
VQLLCAVGIAAACLGASFTYTDHSGDHDWTTCDNWTYSGPAMTCYPSTPGDDVLLPAANGPYTCELISETIDDLTLEHNVTFRALSGTPTLAVDVLVLQAQDENELVITISGATITTGET